MRKLTSERGMSLVEATIILMTLAVLTAVLAPSIGDYVNDARDVKVKEDVEALGTAIARLKRDVTTACLVLDATSTCTLANRADVLYSDGADPTVSVGAYTVENSAITGTSVNWLGATSNAATQKDTFENQLVANSPNGNSAKAYSSIANNYNAAGPQSGLGWRGAYLSSPIGADPWGHIYQANTAFLNVANDATAGGTGEGEAAGGWRYDVLVLSAGRNGDIETKFANDAAGAGGLVRRGDDVVYVVQGSTR